MKITTPLGIFIGFFALGFIIILIQWMCLCCCCCCPSCCPSKCCQKDENEQYTKCELYWPSIFLILLLLLIIIVSAMGISKAGTFKDGLGDIQCSLSMMLDDVVNGNLTTSGSYFIGVDPLITQITALNTNIGTINSSMVNLNTTLSSLSGVFTTMSNNVKNVPDGSGGSAVINYLGNIGDTAPATTGSAIPSKFIDVLGNSTNTASIIGVLYTSLTSTSSVLNSIQTGSAAFASGTVAFQSAIGNINSDLGKVKTQMSDMDNSLSSSLSLMDTPKSMGTMVISVIYGVMLGLSVLALLGVVLMTFCDKYKCRYLMYFSCVILFFLGILGFLLAVIFSIIVPVMFLLCEWLDVTLQASTFSANTGKFISDTTVQNIISTCLAGGSGDIIAVVGGPAVGTTINGLKDSVSKTNSFNTSTSLGLITTNLNTITDTIKDFQYGRIMDIADTNALATLSGISSQSGCAALATDSFVPSMNTFTSTFTLPFTPQAFPCSVGGIINSTTCTQVNFEMNPSPCHGCIDFSDVYNAWYTSPSPNGTATLANAAAWKTKLDNRYGSATPCIGTWSTTFGNVWQNYYKIKTDSYSPILNRWKAVSDGTNPTSDITQVTNAFNTINGTMSSVITTLSGSLDSITNAKYGLIAGLNCQIIGEDLNLVIASICISNFNTFYITRLLMGIAAFGILFAMCCIVCSGVRHFKHSERKDRVSPNFNGEKNSFEHTDAAFRP